MGTIVAKAGILAGLAITAGGSSYLCFDTTPLSEMDSKARPFASPLLPQDQRVVISDAQIIATFARPLFSPSRRPFVASVAEPVAVPDTQVVAEAPVVRRPRRLRLMGVNAHGSRFTVLVKNTETEEIRWLKKGENLDGWILNAADADHAEFICAEAGSNDCSYQVMLYGERKLTEE